MFHSLRPLASRAALVLATTTLLMSAPSYSVPTRRPFRAVPSLVVWAWERPEDLRGLDPNVGIAFLAQTITVRDGEVSVVPRRQPLRVAPDAHLLAVTRIEASDASSHLQSQETLAIATTIARTASMRQVAGIQIDFDATRSQRDFYRLLILELRRRLAPDSPISITALASWCVEDQWLRSVGVDEVVPAIFRMGPTNQPFRDLGIADRWPAAECRDAVGTSLDEPVALDSVRRRVYVFNPKPWNAGTIAAARHVVR